MIGVSRPSVNRILKAVRQRIAEFRESESPFDTGEIEIDESCFGARRVRGIRGRGAPGKHIVFGLIKRGGQVYSQVVRNCFAAERMPINMEKVNEESVVYIDGFTTYYGLVDIGYEKSTIDSNILTTNSLTVPTISMA